MTTVPDVETIQTLLDLLNPLHCEIDRQLPNQFTDEREWDAPDDREYNIDITARMERDLTQAVLILEDRKRAAPSPVLPPSGTEGLAIQRLRAAVSGDDFAWEVNRGSPFDDVQVLLDEYDRLRALSASVAGKADDYRHVVDEALVVRHLGVAHGDPRKALSLPHGAGEAIWQQPSEREAVARAIFGDGWKACADLGPYVQSTVNELTEARKLIEIFEQTNPDLVEKWRDLIEQRNGDNAAAPSPALDPGTVTACAKVAENFYNITSTDTHTLEFGKLVASQIAGGIRALLASQCTPRTLDPVTVVEAIERVLCSFACGKDCERGGNRGDIGLGPCDECTLDFWRSNERKAIRALLASPAPSGETDWKDDPSSDERWNAGLDFGMRHFCYALGVDPKSVRWDAATETLDGDVIAVIWNILRAKMGDDWDPDAPHPIGNASEAGPVSSTVQTGGER